MLLRDADRGAFCRSVDAAASAVGTGLSCAEALSSGTNYCIAICADVGGGKRRADDPIGLATHDKSHAESQRGKHEEISRKKNGGAEGNRTPDLVIANDALSQLSYGPDLLGEAHLVARSEGCQGEPARNSDQIVILCIGTAVSPFETWKTPACGAAGECHLNAVWALGEAGFIHACPEADSHRPQEWGDCAARRFRAPHRTRWRRAMARAATVHLAMPPACRYMCSPVNARTH